MKDLKVFMKNINQIHMNMAKDAFPLGADAICVVCKTIQYMTTASCADALAHGWPKHCGKEMRIVAGK